MNALLTPELEKLLALQIEEHKPTKPTFFEITGYSYYEDIVSNWYAFFFDTSKPHGCGTLFLEALRAAHDLKFSESPIAWDGFTCTSQREFASGGGFLDILLTNSAEEYSHAVLIENKVNAGYDYNPYDSYYEAVNTQNKTAILLTLKPIREREHKGFRNITHSELLREVRNRIGHYYNQIDPHYARILSDFLQNIDSMTHTDSADTQALEVLIAHGPQVKKLLEIRKLGMAALAKQLAAAFTDKGYKVEATGPVSLTLVPGYAPDVKFYLGYANMFYDRNYTVAAWLFIPRLVNIWKEWDYDDEWSKFADQYPNTGWYIGRAGSSPDYTKYASRELSFQMDSVKSIPVLVNDIAEEFDRDMKEPTLALLKELSRRDPANLP